MSSVGVSCSFTMRQQWATVSMGPDSPLTTGSGRQVSAKGRGVGHALKTTGLICILILTFAYFVDASSKQTPTEQVDISELRRPMVNPIDVPLYTIHMEPEFPSTWIFGSESTPPIPAGFFGPRSDPWRGSISCVGNPLDRDGAAPTADLVVRHEIIKWIPNPEKRYGPAEIPKNFKLRCDMVKLSERSTEPITVTHNGGKRQEQWDVTIELAKDHPGGGLIEITHINSDGNGGLADIEIAVKVVFIFKHTRNKKVLTLESPVEWLSETNHSFARWLDPAMRKRVYISEGMQGSFIPATRMIDGQGLVMAGCSKNVTVTHSFVLAPRVEAIGSAWGTLSSIRQFPPRFE